MAMSMDALEYALVLISQGKTREAQILLKPLMTADPHNIPAWLLFVKTCPTDQLRLQALEHCLMHNPDNPKIRKSFEDLQGAIAEKSKDVLLISWRPDKKKETSTKPVFPDQDLKTLDKSSKEVADHILLTRKRLISKKLVWMAYLVIAIISSIAVRLLAPGYLLLLTPCLLLIPIGIHFAVHLFVIARTDFDSPTFDAVILVSHLFLFLCYLTQMDMDDSNSANALTRIFAEAGLPVSFAINNLLSNLSCIFGFGLLFSWLALGIPWFHVSREKRGA